MLSHIVHSGCAILIEIVRSERIMNPERETDRWLLIPQLYKRNVVGERRRKISKDRLTSKSKSA